MQHLLFLAVLGLGGHRVACSHQKTEQLGWSRRQHNDVSLCLLDVTVARTA